MAIEIPELGDQRHQLWCDLMEMAQTFPGQWTIIGAHMVALYAWEAGIDVRPSDDVDVLVNVRVATNASGEVSRFLSERNYEAEVTRSGVAHLFRREAAQIDVFVPDGIGQRTSRETIPGHRTLLIPGGTQALQRTELVTVQSRSTSGELPRPNLLGAILVKVRAIEVDDLPNAQRADVALLLGLVEDPDALATQLTKTERGWLRRHPYFADLDDPTWNNFDAADPEQSALVFRRLARL